MKKEKQFAIVGKDNKHFVDFGTDKSSPYCLRHVPYDLKIFAENGQNSFNKNEAKQLIKEKRFSKGYKIVPVEKTGFMFRSRKGGRK